VFHSAHPTGCFFISATAPATIMAYQAKLNAAALSSVFNWPSNLSTDMTVFTAAPDKATNTTLVPYSLAANEQVKQGANCFHTLWANVQVLGR
jgi:hypothetical protein